MMADITKMASEENDGRPAVFFPNEPFAAGVGDTIESAILDVLRRKDAAMHSDAEGVKNG